MLRNNATSQCNIGPNLQLTLAASDSRHPAAQRQVKACRQAARRGYGCLAAYCNAAPAALGALRCSKLDIV